MTKKYRRFNGQRYNVNRLPMSQKAQRVLLGRPLVCAYCGRGPDKAGKLTADHVHPQSKGGTHSPDNLVLACAPCNLAKGAMSVEEFLAKPRIISRQR